MSYPFDIATAIQHPADSAIWVTKSGEVWRKINNNHPERRQWIQRKFDTDKDGYKKCRIAGFNWPVHRLVHSLFIGELVPGMVVCHLDGNPENNMAGNLLQASQATNVRHKILHGTEQRRDAHPRAVRTSDEADAVIAALSTAARTKTGRLARGETQRIADEIGVPRYFVSDVANKGAWQ